MNVFIFVFFMGIFHWDYLWTTLGFGLGMEVIFLIPGAFLLLLPAGVCGATRLVVAAERVSIDQPLLSNDVAI